MAGSIELLVGNRDDLTTATKLLNFRYALVVGNKLLEKKTNMLGYDAVELLHTFPCGFLVIPDNAIKMVAANTDAVEDQLEK